MKTRVLCMIVTLALLGAGLAPAWGQAAPPATLKVTHRAALGKLSKATWDNGVRWGQVAVTTEGHLLVFYCNDKRKIVYQLSTDGRSFAQPVQVASGLGPAVALDAEDNIYLIYKGARKRASFKKLPKTAPGKWDVSGKSVQPFVQFGEGPMNFPSLLILPGSRRIWCMYNYQKSDIFSLPRETPYARRKPRGQAVVSYSDDGGKSWADPVYVGSDSGDEGSGIVVLRPWGGRATWFWTFWDCATPAWGRFDGSRIRPVREFFPHKRARMAVGHPWDTATGPDEKLYFATGMGSYTNGQVYKVFDGRAWSKEIWLSHVRGMAALLPGFGRLFCAVTEGGRVSLYQLDGTTPATRGVIYTPPEGKALFRPLPVPAERGTKGYLPLFLVEATPRKIGNRTRLEDMYLKYLRLEVKELSGEAAAGPIDLSKARNPRAYKHAPLEDDRIEPRTDVAKDRKIVRAGNNWMLIYADDDPGRLVAAPLTGDKAGGPIVLIDKPAMGRFQCSAIADGPDVLVATGGPDGTTFFRARDLGAKSSPKAAASPIAPKQDQALVIPGGKWPTLCRAADGKLLVVSVVEGKLITAVSGDKGKTFRSLDPVAAAAGARPASVVAGKDVLLLVGSTTGISCRRWEAGKWGSPQQVVKDRWVGNHFSAAAAGDRVELIYAPGESYLGKKLIGHVRYDKGAWKAVAAVDTGNVARGLSLCSVGDDKLLAVYCVRNPRPTKVDKGAEKMKRFTHTLYQRTFDGKAWGGPVKVAWPKVPVYRPKGWTDWHDVGGVIYVPEVDLGRFPTLPAAAPANDVPVAWMVPGFNCMPKKERVPRDRGGLLVTTRITAK